MFFVIGVFFSQARRRRCCLSCRGNGCQSNRGLWRARGQVIAWARVFDLVEVFSFDRGSLWTRVEDLSRIWFASTVCRSLPCCYCLWCWIKSKHYFRLSGFNRFLYIYLSFLLLVFGFIKSELPCLYTLYIWFGSQRFFSYTSFHHVISKHVFSYSHCCIRNYMFFHAHAPYIALKKIQLP